MALKNHSVMIEKNVEIHTDVVVEVEFDSDDLQEFLEEMSQRERLELGQSILNGINPSAAVDTYFDALNDLRDAGLKDGVLVSYVVDFLASLEDEETLRAIFEHAHDRFLKVVEQNVKADRALRALETGIAVENVIAACEDLSDKQVQAIYDTVNDEAVIS